MSMDFNGREPETSITEQEGVMFAAQPVWERNRKRKGFGGRKTATPATTVVTPDPVVAPETRSFASDPVLTPEPRSFSAERDDETMALDRPLHATPTMTHSTLAADDDVGLVAPIATARTTRSAKSNSVAPAAIAAAVIGLGALGAAGWYMTREPAGVPELAAGSITTETAVAPLVPTEPPAQVAVNEVPPAPAPTLRAEQPTKAAAVARARPRQAAAPSAGESGVNASTTAVLPDGPQPYAPTPGTTAPTQVNPPAVALPPSSEAPAATPATPTLPQEPVTEAPTPETTTPPQ